MNNYTTIYRYHQAEDYLVRLLNEAWKKRGLPTRAIEDDPVGLATQVDNYIAGLHRIADAAYAIRLECALKHIANAAVGEELSAHIAQQALDTYDDTQTATDMAPAGERGVDEEAATTPQRPS